MKQKDKLLLNPGVNDVFTAIKHHLGVSKETILSNKRSIFIDNARRMFSTALYQNGVAVVEIAVILDLTRNGIYKQIRVHRNIMDTEEEYAQLFRAILSQIKTHQYD